MSGGGQKQALGVMFKPKIKLTISLVLPKLIGVRNSLSGGFLYIKGPNLTGSWLQSCAFVERLRRKLDFVCWTHDIDSVLIQLNQMLDSDPQEQWQMICSQETPEKGRLLLDLALIWMGMNQRNALFWHAVESVRSKVGFTTPLTRVLDVKSGVLADKMDLEWIDDLLLFTQLIAPFKIRKQALRKAWYLFKTHDAQKVDFSSQHFTTDEHFLFAALLKRHVDIETVCLSHANLSQKALEAYISAFSELPVLKKWYLNGNTLRYNSVLLLSDFVFSHPSIEALFLSETSLGDESMKALADGLFYSNSLKQLDLSRNHLSADGLGCLSHALCGGAKLTHLDISENPIKGDLSSFCKGLILNQSLRVINVSKTKMRSENRLRFLQAINFHSGSAPLKIRA